MLDKFLREDAKLTEAQKPLAICGILIALKDDDWSEEEKKLQNYLSNFSLASTIQPMKIIN